MKAFRFPLQKALDWRRKQLELEEVRYKQRVGELAALDRARAELEQSGSRAETEVRGWESVAGCDLGALGRFRLRVRQEGARIAERRVEAAKKVAVQQEAMLEARRRCRLLEKLRERRVGEWETERDREMEEVASEAYLGQWGRGASGSDGDHA